MAKLTDTISAKEAKGWITVDGSNRELFEATKVEAYIELTVKEKGMLGSRMMQHKVIGAKGTGSATMHFMNNEQGKAAVEYLNSGKYPNISLQLKNEDPASSVGRQENVLNGVIFNKIPLNIFDGESDDVVTYDTDFTFDGINNLSQFTLPESY